MRRALRAQKGRLGRAHRDTARQLDESATDRTKHLMATVERLLNQKSKDKSKLHALHAPKVECISKGKAHKRYEFCVKASFAITAKEGWVVDARTFAGNPYDGHTLYSQVEQVEILTNVCPKLVLADKGYRGGPSAGRCGIQTLRLFSQYKALAAKVDESKINDRAAH